MPFVMAGAANPDFLLAGEKLQQADFSGDGNQTIGENHHVFSNNNQFDVFQRINALIDNSSDLNLGFSATASSSPSDQTFSNNFRGNNAQDMATAAELLGLNSIFNSFSGSQGFGFNNSIGFGMHHNSSSMSSPSSMGLGSTTKAINQCNGNLINNNAHNSLRFSDFSSSFARSGQMSSSKLGSSLSPPSSTSPTFSPFRPIRGSSFYNNDSPKFDHSFLSNQSSCRSFDFRSNSPTGSESSGVSSVDSQLAEMMGGLSVVPPTRSSSPMGNCGLYSCLFSSSNDNSDFDSSGLSSSLLMDRRWTSGSVTSFANDSSLDRAAKLHRNAASMFDATCTWSGHLPLRTCKNPTYSCKVFLGGVPWDITECALMNAFKPFGPIKIEWPGKENSPNPPKGYVYILFESEKQVKSLLQACTHDFSNGGNWYFKISSRRMRCKEVQVIPWMIGDSNYVKYPSQRLDPNLTVFVGALHGMLTAEGLARIMDDLFGGVVYSGIDTDKHKYPIGSGRLSFSNHKSYMKAVAAAFIEIKTPKFTKKVQVDPYLEDSPCYLCNNQQGPYFCRDGSCFRYFCRSCWQWQHSIVSLSHHKPLMRNSKSTTGTSPSLSLN